MGACRNFRRGGGEPKKDLPPHKDKKGPPHTCREKVANRPPHGKKSPYMVKGPPPKEKNEAKGPQLEKR